MRDWESDEERIFNKQPFKIGVVGYSTQKFNTVKAKVFLKRAFGRIERDYGEKHYFIVVSGLTALGVPKLAYEEAAEREWRTKGIACEKAMEHELWPVDETIIFGEEWGDESNMFLNDIDFLVRIGGGDQSMEETASAYRKQIPVLEFDL